MLKLKCVVVGDGAVGKTCLLIMYTAKTFPTDYVPTVFDNYFAHIEVDGKEVALGLWDTAGQEEYDRLRPLSYPQADVFLVCYAVNSKSTLNNIKAKWIPELNHFAPQVPYLLVGTKSDLKSSSEEVVGLAEAQKVANEIGAAGCMECSALTGQGIEEVFAQAVRLCLVPKQRKKKGKCQLL